MEDNKNTIVGIVGLGLIGGSMAKAVTEKTDHIVYGLDKDRNTAKLALDEKSIVKELGSENLHECDYVIMCLYPQGNIDFVTNNIKKFKKDCIIIDCGGVKELICKKLSPLCKENGIHFIGGHPMAGTEKSGYENSFAGLFDGATVIFCQDTYTDPLAFGYAQKLFKDIGFSKITSSTPSEHDRMIAFTSQLAHVVSNAYVQSSTAQQRLGFSGGSYRDLTRVAYLNEEMWSQLFLENSQHLVSEIRSLAARLEEYADLIEDKKITKLKELLKKGKDIKADIG